MPALTTVVAIAVSCGVVFIVTTVVGTIVWVRIRQERLSLAVANSRDGPYVHGLQTFPTETLTELSREEGSALRQYGQLPYGRPNEWGLLASRESLVQSTADSEASPNFMEKARGLRRSLSQSLSRSQSARRSRSFVRPRRLSSLAPLKETTERASPPPHSAGAQDDDMPTSAVDGAFELPTERTPRHTPERDDEMSPSMDSSTRHMSGQWIGAHQRERSGSLFPVIEDNLLGFEQGRARGGSITAQSAGLMPEQPVPPPPSAYPPNRFRLSKNDSIGLSSLSLETADSSILDDGRRGSVGIDGDFVSPALPPCPTFAPYSANDVGRMEYDRRSFLPPSSIVPAPFIFPPNSPAREVQRIEPDRHSPRRSLTARSPSCSSGQVGPAPRRSESLSTTTTSQSRRESMYADLDQIPPLNPAPRNSALLPHFSQMQRHSVYGNPQREHDPFIASAHSVSGFIGSANAPSRRPNSFSIQEAHLQTSATHPRPPLPSAMKGGSGPRKGHRRQNCVRISIHPPITFGAPAFSPMVEEPEELDNGDRRRSEVSDLSTSNMSLLNSSVSSLSMNRSSYHELANDRPRTIEAPESRPISSYRSPSKKRKHSRHDSGDSVVSASDNDKTLPELVTSLPTTTESSMSRTPSPDKHAPLWTVPNHIASPTIYESSPSPGSPRRSAVKGPRSLSAKPGRNSFRALPLDENASSGTEDPVPRTKSMRRETITKSADSLQRAKSSSAVDSPLFTAGRIAVDMDRRNNRSSTTAQQFSSGANQTPWPHVGRIVPIWEDRAIEQRQSTQKPSVSLVNEPAELQGEVPPTPKRDPSRGRQMSRPAFTTPIKKTVGLGIGAATPGSLYDGDGFLKEG
ncbi:hypothetical protein P170DRAFT_414683 [Aspergillus steynii IBT 23096]|uniref:Uncharacterized protein n=1 Tax=Aspergillus steynii IBT 23096 TaxID=1392250 RepID=A0A2I2FZ94_9EURO|nr:uncharacterized protein P170DRAFT_414683 [Aspergillus steynii IBT 23096]PLB45952.1 hypothetical protein P170DRAFT_414683 [Aspergillus steynii IBT 23096]